MSDRFNINSFGVPEHHHAVSPGSFLVASMAQEGTPFQRSVVFVLQVNEQGTFGAVLNRPAGQDIITHWNKETGLQFERQNVVEGGPLSGPVLAIHDSPPIAEVQVSGNVCFSVNAQTIQDLSKQTDSQYRIVLGIVAWNHDQLHGELGRGLWYPLSANPMHVFDEQDQMWESFIRECGRRTIASIVGESLIPDDPTCN